MMTPFVPLRVLDSIVAHVEEHYGTGYGIAILDSYLTNTWVAVKCWGDGSVFFLFATRSGVSAMTDEEGRKVADAMGVVL